MSMKSRYKYVEPKKVGKGKMVWCAKINSSGKTIHVGNFPFTDAGELQAFQAAYAERRKQDAIKVFAQTCKALKDRMFDSMQLLKIKDGLLSALGSDKINATKRPQIDAIVNVTCAYFGIPELRVKSKGRKREVVQCRQIGMYYMVKFKVGALKAIGDIYGGFDHTTVIHSCRTVEDLMATDARYKENVAAIGMKIELSLLEINNDTKTEFTADKKSA